MKLPLPTLRASSLALLLGIVSMNAHAVSNASFVDDASAKGVAEIQTSQLALQKSQSTDVKTFAQMMIDDHTAANQQLSAIAQKLNLKVATDAQLMNKAKKMVLQYRDDSFDKAYAANQVKAHQDTIKLFQDEIKTSTAPALKQFAEHTLPKLQAHLEAAQKLQANHP